MSPEEDTGGVQGSSCCRGPQQVLLVTLVTNAIFTVSQFVGSVLSNSLALYGDSLDMAIDTITYALNLWVERVRDSGINHRRALYLEVVVSLISGLSLTGATVFLFIEAVRRLEAPEDDTEEEPIYVLVFSGINLLIDFVQIFFFVREFIKHLRHRKRDATAFNVNLASAAAHVLADTIRTLSELCSAFLSVKGGLDPVLTDAWASFVVNAVVLVSGFGLLFSVFTKWKQLRGGVPMVAMYKEVSMPQVDVDCTSVQPQGLARFEVAPSIEVLPT